MLIWKRECGAYIYIYIYIFIYSGCCFGAYKHFNVVVCEMMREIPPWQFSLEGTPPTLTAICECIEVVGWGKLGEGQDPGPHGSNA